MITAEELVLEINNSEENNSFKLGIVVELFENSTAKIQFDGEETPSEKQYAYLSSYIPVINDRVLLGVLGGTYIILGKINYNVSPDIEVEIDRYLFDLKKVIMQMGLSVTGSTDLDEAAIDGNLGVSGTVTAQGISASGTMSAGNVSTSGQVSAGSLSVTGAILANEVSPSGAPFSINGNFLHKGSSIGFFNRSLPAQQRSITKITSPDPTNADLKNKINEIIDVLQWYNLIG